MSSGYSIYQIQFLAQFQEEAKHIFMDVERSLEAELGQNLLSFSHGSLHSTQLHGSLDVVPINEETVRCGRIELSFVMDNFIWDSHLSYSITDSFLFLKIYAQTGKMKRYYTATYSITLPCPTSTPKDAADAMRRFFRYTHDDICRIIKHVTL